LNPIFLSTSCHGTNLEFSGEKASSYMSVWVSYYHKIGIQFIPRRFGTRDVLLSEQQMMVPSRHTREDQKRSEKSQRISAHT
jgi:hypothetical protein